MRCAAPPHRPLAHSNPDTEPLSPRATDRTRVTAAGNTLEGLASAIPGAVHSPLFVSSE